MNAKHKRAASLLLAILFAGATSYAQQDQSERDWAKLKPILEKIHGIATGPPKNLVTPKYTAGALMGNGDIGVVAGDLTVNAQRFYFGKSDFWGTHWNTGHNAPEVSILSLGTLSISSAAGTSGDAGAYRVDQDSGSIEAINSMLLQHEAGTLRLFPDWPSSMDASFTRLRAKGAYLVSSDQRSGKVRFIDIVSEKGGTLTIQSPWGTVSVSVSSADKRATSLSANASGRLTLATIPGGAYCLSPK